MSDDTPKGDDKPAGVDVAALQQEFDEFNAIVEALRTAIRTETNAHLVRTNVPTSPGLILAALIGEAANVCALWGVTQRLKVDDIEDVFNQALRNGRRVLRGNLLEYLQGTSPQN